nr:unnamed protein product [Callosobruchus chinensis]
MQSKEGQFDSSVPPP